MGSAVSGPVVSLIVCPISGVREGRTRGTLKKPKMSRYSSSFGAGIVVVAMEEEEVWLWWLPMAVKEEEEERG